MLTILSLIFFHCVIDICNTISLVKHVQDIIWKSRFDINDHQMKKAAITKHVVCVIYFNIFIIANLVMYSCLVVSSDSESTWFK